MRPGELCGEDVASGADGEGQVIFTGGGEEELWRCERTQDLEPEEGRGYHGLSRQDSFILTGLHHPVLYWSVE